MSDAVMLHIKGEVNGRMLDQVRGDLARVPKASRISLLVDSYGGDVGAAKGIYRAIRQHPAAIKRGVVVKQCASAAVIVLMAADYRRAQANAKILLHQTAIEPVAGGRWTARRYAEAAARCKQIDDEMLEIMAERTGSSRASLAREEETDRLTPMPKVLALGIVHEATGFPSRCTPSWPDAARAIARSGGLIGLPQHMFSPAFLAACRAAPRSP